MLAASATTERYRCPGEEYDITRSVHLARLAASYTKCRNCPHASGSAVSLESAETEPMPAPELEGMSLFGPEGVRGRYLNELTRATAAKISGAMASCLWDGYARPESAPSDTVVDDDLHVVGEGIRILHTGGPGPCIVLAHDERPFSPDIVTGVGQALRRMGCEVVDIGLTSRPCLSFAIDHLRAAGGVHVTGAGCDPGWTGVDFFTRGNTPCSAPGELDRIAVRYRQGYSRPSRRPGCQRTYQVTVAYEASLWKHFHALRPLKIALACPSRTVRELFARTFRKLACRLLPVETPTRLRDPLDPADPDVERTSRQVCEARADLGMLVDDDGERCAFFDEQGRLVPPRLAAEVLSAGVGAEPNSSTASSRVSGLKNPAGPISRSVPAARLAENSSREQVVLAMREHSAAFARDGMGRYWFAEAYPACDALLTLVHLLQALSRSDLPFSEVVGNADSAISVVGGPAGE